MGSTPTVRSCDRAPRTRTSGVPLVRATLKHCSQSSGTRTLVAILLTVLLVSPASGHEFRITDSLLLLKSDQTFQLDLRIDVDALALGVPASTDSGEVKRQLNAATPEELSQFIENAKRTLQTRVRVRIDDAPAALEIAFPEHGTALAREARLPTVLGVTARLVGVVPDDAVAVTVQLSRAMGPPHLTIMEQGTLRAERQLLAPGQESARFALNQSVAAGAGSENADGGFGHTLTRYIALGFEHIVPIGLDHILFVLGLFLLSSGRLPRRAANDLPSAGEPPAATARGLPGERLSRRAGIALPLGGGRRGGTAATDDGGRHPPRRASSGAAATLLAQITAFTLAHSITLALSMFEVVSLPSRLVETLIALSIAYVGIENVFARKLHVWRIFLVFAFGLLHGLGFAGVLSELGLPRGQFGAALVGFNVGVELGQIAVVLLAFAAVGWFQRADWYRSRVVVPASVGIALIGLVWAVERGFSVTLIPPIS